MKQQQRQHKHTKIGTNTISVSTDTYAIIILAVGMNGSAPSNCLQGQYKKSNMESGLIVVVVTACSVAAKERLLFPNGTPSKGDCLRLLNTSSAAATDARNRVATTLPQRTRPRGLPPPVN